MIRFACPQCHKGFQVEDNAAGKKTKCPKCGTAITVPSFASNSVAASMPLASNRVTDETLGMPAEDTDIYGLASALASPVVSNGNKLIPCKTCGSSIAKNAKTCPKCGAPNEWYHPEVRRFIDNYKQIAVPSECYYHWTAESVSGTATVERGAGNVGFKLVIGALLVSLLLGGTMAGPIFMLIAGFMVFVGVVLILVSMLGPYNSSDNMVTFEMDFDGPTPRWTSTDDKFWAKVKEFFRIR